MRYYQFESIRILIILQITCKRYAFHGLYLFGSMYLIANARRKLFHITTVPSNSTE